MHTSFSNPRLLAVFALLVICATASAQVDGKKVPVDSLLHLERGLSQQKVEEIFGTPAHHQFSVRVDGQLIRCVRVAFESRGSYYFVFTNNTLAKICEPPRVEYKRLPYKNTWREIPVYDDPERRMKTVLEAADLTEPALAESLKKRIPPPKSGSMNVLPAFIIAAPFWAATASSRAAQRAETEELAKKYDPLKVKLGMSIEQVETMFGEPHVKETLEAQRETRYYGSAKLGADHLLWISVVFESGQAVRVFTGSFFDMNKIYKQY